MDRKLMADPIVSKSQKKNNTPDVMFSSLLDVQSIGFTLYTFASVWLFVASLILLLAMIGPIVLTLKVRQSV